MAKMTQAALLSTPTAIAVLLSNTRVSALPVLETLGTQTALCPSSMLNTLQKRSQRHTDAQATVWIRVPVDDTYICLLFTTQHHTRDTQLSQCLAKISTWKSRSWLKLSTQQDRG